MREDLKKKTIYELEIQLLNSKFLLIVMVIFAALFTVLAISISLWAFFIVAALVYYAIGNYRIIMDIKSKIEATKNSK